MENIEIENIEFALAMATLGQIGLSTVILSMRSTRTQTYLPLVMFLLACAVIVSKPVILVFWPELITHHIALTLPAYLMMGPMLWLYVCGLVSETPWRIKARHLWHMVLPSIGLITAVLSIALPDNTRNLLFVQGKIVDSLYPLILVSVVFVLILAWLVQSAYYLVYIIKSLSKYRKRLHQLFASDEHSELYWLYWFAGLVGGICFITIVSVLSDNFGDNSIASPLLGSILGFILVWFLGIWGLRQRPGFHSRYLEPNELEPSEFELHLPKKYGRSALGYEQSERIAKKINGIMTTDKLYLDPNISLPKLAKALSISQNHISQTLNQTMGESFFNYINRWRIEAAKDKLVSDRETIVQIAYDVGFNTPSTFYKSYKRVTGQTPKDFRKTVMKLAVEQGSNKTPRL